MRTGGGGENDRNDGGFLGLFGVDGLLDVDDGGGDCDGVLDEGFGD